MSVAEDYEVLETYVVVIRRIGTCHNYELVSVSELASAHKKRLHENSTCATRPAPLVSAAMSGDTKKYWRKDELRPALQDLASKIDQEVQAKGISLRALADAAGISERTLTRWFVDGKVPMDEAGVERMLHVAVTAGLGREEAESSIPEPSMLVPAQSTGGPPTQKAMNEMMVQEIRLNREVMTDILAEVRRLGVQVERLLSQRSQQR